MALTLYNSLTRRKEPFVPIDDQNVRMYVCGPTVYDYAHIGNGRAVVVFDQLYRMLRQVYGAEHVKYVRNITDIEDKIIDAARANGETIETLTQRTAQIFRDDMAALGALPPDVEPRATAHVPHMIAMIEKLIAGGYAYAAQGHVLFAVASWHGYGKLSRRSRDEMVAGARIEVAPYKSDPGDFVLWKPSSSDQPGWDSPWGRGRPGWHIECSAMSEAHLGSTFDIHGGGVDLIFPHHENEVAQSEAAHGGTPFVKFWVHNGFLSVESTKMSKSLGNFVTVHELLEQGIPGEVLRLALLMTHYRDPLDWTERRIEEATFWANKFYRAFEDAPALLEVIQKPDILSALEDDLNTPLAITSLQRLATELVVMPIGPQKSALQAEFLGGAHLLGLLGKTAKAWFQGDEDIDTEFVEAQIAARALARKERRFADADLIRAELAAEGVVLEDRPDGTTDWRRT